MKRILTVFLILTVPVLAFAGPPGTLWTRTYGGDSPDFAWAVQQTPDGGYIVAGHTNSFGPSGYNMYLVKTNSTGDTVWTRWYGGSSNDVAESVQQTTDGGYIVAGWTFSFGAGSVDFYLVKTDATGDTVWTRCYGGSFADKAYAVQQTTDGGYIVAGYTESFGAGHKDFWLVKTDATGDTLWTQWYGGGGYEVAYDVQQTTDGGYIIAGYTDSFGPGGYNMYLVKTNATGDSVLWTRTYGGSLIEYAYAVQQTTNGGYIVAGFTYSFGEGSYDFYLVKTNSTGDTVWTRCYGGSESETACGVQQTTDGGYIIAGYTNSFGAGYKDFWLVKTDASGNFLWNCSFGGSNDEECRSVQQTTDGGYILGGWTESYGAGGADVWLVKTGPEEEEPECLWVEMGDHFCLDFEEGDTIDVCWCCPYGTEPWMQPVFSWMSGCDYGLPGCDIACNPITGPLLWDEAAVVESDSCDEYPGSGHWTTRFYLPPGDFGCACVFFEDQLPVELTTFEAFPGDGEVTLNWSTASEMDNEKFEIARRASGDGDLIKIGEVPGAGSSTSEHNYTFVDENVTNEVTYYYQLTAVDFNGVREVQNLIVSATPSRDAVPTEYALYQNYPNPFNPRTLIRYDVKETGLVSLKVFDILGREVATLTYGESPAGSYTISWDASGLPSGIYLCKMEAEGFAQVRKLLLVK